MGKRERKKEKRKLVAKKERPRKGERLALIAEHANIWRPYLAEETFRLADGIMFAKFCGRTLFFCSHQGKDGIRGFATVFLCP